MRLRRKAEEHAGYAQQAFEGGKKCVVFLIIMRNKIVIGDLTRNTFMMDHDKWHECT